MRKFLLLLILVLSCGVVYWGQRWQRNRQLEEQISFTLPTASTAIPDQIEVQINMSEEVTKTPGTWEIIGVLHGTKNRAAQSVQHIIELGPPPGYAAGPMRISWMIAPLFKQWAGANIFISASSVRATYCQRDADGNCNPLLPVWMGASTNFSERLKPFRISLGRWVHNPAACRQGNFFSGKLQLTGAVAEHQYLVAYRSEVKRREAAARIKLVDRLPLFTLKLQPGSSQMEIMVRRESLSVPTYYGALEFELVDCAKLATDLESCFWKRQGRRLEQRKFEQTVISGCGANDIQLREEGAV